jgi:hypothetical protein
MDARFYRMSGKKFHPKRRTLTRRGRESNFATHALGSLLDDGQAHPGTLIFRIGSASLEWLKEASVHVGRDSDAVVLDAEANCFGRGAIIGLAGQAA